MSAIEDLLQEGKSEHLEFQADFTDRDRITATACAFLNTQGGNFLIGIGPRGGATGVPEPEAKAQDISALLQREITPQAPWSVSVDRVAGKEVITIAVPRGLDRPYVCGGTIYLRNGEQTVKADAAAIRRLVEEQYLAPVRWERLPALGLELADLDEPEIRRTAEVAQQQRGYPFRQPGDPEEVLVDLSLLRQGQLTNAADVLFGTNPGPRLPQTRVRATVFAEDKGGDFTDDRVVEGCAFAALENVFAFVQQHVRIEAHFRPGQLTRQDRPQYPFDALREGLINAIIHRDYSAASGGMSVGIYPDRIEIWNSGRLPQGLKVGDLKRTHPSLPANPDMAHVFHLRGLIERLGRGTLKIVEQCKEFGLPPPEWKVAPFGITLVFQAAKAVKSLNKRQRSLLLRLKPGDSVRPGDYYKENEEIVGQRQAQRDLAELERGGWLRQEGEGPATVYTRTELAAPPNPDTIRT
jgi:ATP-dependent DNA helicase RecG